MTVFNANNVWANLAYSSADTSGSYSEARKSAGENGLAELSRIIESGQFSVADILYALMRIVNSFAVIRQQWASGMLNFVQSFKSDFEGMESRLLPNSSDKKIKIDYDQTMQNCMGFVEFLVRGEASPTDPALKVDNVFDRERLGKLRDLWNDKKTVEAVKRLKDGKSLDLTDRQQLQQLFSLAPEVLQALNADYSNAGDGVNSRNTVLISPESLTSDATRITNEINRIMDGFRDRMLQMPDQSRWLIS